MTHTVIQSAFQTQSQFKVFVMKVYRQFCLCVCKYVCVSIAYDFRHIVSHLYILFVGLSLIRQKTFLIKNAKKKKKKFKRKKKKKLTERMSTIITTTSKTTTTTAATAMATTQC